MLSELELEKIRYLRDRAIWRPKHPDDLPIFTLLVDALNSAVIEIDRLNAELKASDNTIDAHKCLNAPGV